MPDPIKSGMSPMFYHTFDQQPPEPERELPPYEPSRDTFNICDGCGNSYARCTCDEEED